MYLMNAITRSFVSKSGMGIARKTYRLICGSNLAVPKRHSSYDADGKTTVQILNKEYDLGLMIDSFSQIGFRLNNGMAVIGPMAIFPRSVLSWNVSGVEEINENSLSLFLHLEPKIDILVLGVGDDKAFAELNRDILKSMRNHRINIEALTTEQACATFNFLNAENRYVAGAFIPPNEIKTTEDDIITTKVKRKNLYKVDDES